MRSGGARRILRLGLALAASLLTSLATPAAAAPAMPDDMALGNPKALVTVYDYASVGCPHCAVWQKEVFPAFKKTWIDPGKVRFVLREMLTGDPPLAAAGFLLARCAGPANYFQVVDAVYVGQAQIIQEGGPTGTLARIAREAGLNDAQFNACLQDKAALAALEARVQRHVDVDGVNSTPTFVIGKAKLEGDQTMAQLKAAIDTALGAASASSLKH